MNLKYFLYIFNEIHNINPFVGLIPGSSSKELFEGHRDLILRLNYYMPDGYEIKLFLLEDEQSHQKKHVKLKLSFH